LPYTVVNENTYSLIYVYYEAGKLTRYNLSEKHYVNKVCRQKAGQIKLIFKNASYSLSLLLNITVLS